MKTKHTLVLALAIVAVLCGAGVFGYLTVSMLSHAGDQAVTQMNSDEREWLQRATRIHKAMGVAEVYAVLGDPTSEIFGLAKWDSFGGSKLSQLRIYFFDGHPRKVRWLKLGYFVYEKDL